MSIYNIDVRRATKPDGTFVGNDEVLEGNLDQNGWRYLLVNSNLIKKIYCYDGFEFYSRGELRSYLREVHPHVKTISDLPRLPDRKVKYRGLA